MNTLEKEMIEVLKELRDVYGVFEIKAEFEAEGSRMEEMMRLKDITSSVNLPIILKIGGHFGTKICFDWENGPWAPRDPFIKGGTPPNPRRNPAQPGGTLPLGSLCQDRVKTGPFLW